MYWRDCYGNEKLKISCQNKSGKVRGWECKHLHRKNGSFLSVCAQDLKIVGTQENLSNLWAILRKKVDFEAPTPLLDQVNLGCTQHEYQIIKRSVMEKQKLFTQHITTNTDVKIEETSRVASLQGATTCKVTLKSAQDAAAN